MQKRIAALGLDLGTKRIGVAGCDGLGITVTGLTTINRTSWQRDLTELRYWVEERRAEILVIGLPYRLDGSLGSQAEKTQKLAEKISAALQLPIAYVDERLTSFEAEEMMRDQGVRVMDNKAMIDRKAAAIILQQWLKDTAPERQGQNSL